ncbi:MAG: DUF2339 domain-containing protein [Alphaproteobacteria bacterium]|nr:DUF2339 domain-containing protein [Alphaproteobacteria bacterium]
MDDFLWLFLYAAFVFLAPIVALVKIRGLKQRVVRLERALVALHSGRHAVEPVQAAQAAPAADAPPPIADDAAAPSAAGAEAAPPPVAPPPEPPPEPIFASEPPMPAAAGPRVSFEQKLTERWAVWLGAVALALGGVFLVRYSIEAGLLGPGTRVTLGLLLGLGLAAAGEALRERWHHWAALEPLAEGYVPKAISAAGVVIAFASIYAAYSLHDLIPSLVAFAALAAIALGAVALSLLQGQFIALVGLVGAYITPLLAGDPRGAVVGLMAYLLFVTAACFALVRHRRWWWLAWSGHAGFAGLSLLWIADNWMAPDGALLAWFALGFAVLVAWIAATLRFAPAVLVAKPVQFRLTPFEFAVWGGMATAAALFFVTLRMAHYQPIGLLPFGLFCALLLAGGRIEQVFGHIAWVGAAAAVAIAAVWHEPTLTEIVPSVETSQAFQLIPGPPVFLAAATILAALFGIGGFAAMAGSALPSGWAALSAAVPLALAVIGYGRLGGGAPDLPWSGVALALAALNLFAATRVAPLRAEARFEAALAVYAIGVIAACAFAMTIALSLAWLTVGLAILVAAIAEVYRRIRLAALRHVAALVAGAVLSRLVLNRFIVDYDLGTWPIVNGLLYAYGIPILAFAHAARVFRAVALDRDATLIETGAVILAMALGTLEIHHLMSGGKLAEPLARFTEPALMLSFWLLAAVVLLEIHRRNGRLLYRWCAVIAVAGAAVAFGPLVLLADSPLLSRIAVGETMIADWLLPAYALPGLLLAAFGRRAEPFVGATWRGICATAALLLGLIYVTLEVRHGFAGPIIAVSIFGAAPGDAEWYSYSVAWLAYGFALLAAGIRIGLPALRWASLAVVALAVAKVFISDLSALAGLWRALSFLGLGACLIALGWAYQRFVFIRPPPPAGETS